jgi:CheY-like chemotaxis protein
VLPYLNKILIVEDIGLIALDLKTMLVSTGFSNIKVAYNGVDAIHISNTYLPDLVLMDIMLGDGIDGIEAARTIRQNHYVQLIYITGSTDVETQKKAQKTYPAAIIQKPVHLPELEDAVMSALGLNPDRGLSLQGI